MPDGGEEDSQADRDPGLGVEDKRILIRGTSSPQDSMCERKNALFK